MKFKSELLRSPRMERVLKVLIEHGSPSTKEIEDRAQVASARDYIRRLRDKGYKIETIEEGINENGARIVRYRLHLGAHLESGDLFGPAPDQPSGVTYRD